MQITKETNRLLLDNIKAEDHEFIISLVNSKGWLQFIGDRKVHSREEAIAYINRIRHTRNFYYWVVRTKDENIPIGVISFLKRDYLEHFDIGFAFLPEYIGKGYAQEAASAVLSALSAYPEHKRILATTRPDNLNSIRLLGKLGFYFEKAFEIGKEKLYIYGFPRPRDTSDDQKTP
jgi:RimJ/RimL family protein N-acetyltransferase